MNAQGITALEIPHYCLHSKYDTKEHVVKRPEQTGREKPFSGKTFIEIGFIRNIECKMEHLIFFYADISCHYELTMLFSSAAHVHLFIVLIYVKIISGANSFVPILDCN